MPNQRKKILGLCDCGDIAKYGAFRLSLPDSPWVRACFKCIKLIELENKVVEESMGLFDKDAIVLNDTYIRDSKLERLCRLERSTFRTVGW